MLSRVAETSIGYHAMWSARENTARLISVNSNLLLDLPGGIAPGWGNAGDIMGVRSDFDKRFKEPTSGVS